MQKVDLPLSYILLFVSSLYDKNWLSYSFFSRFFDVLTSVTLTFDLDLTKNYTDTSGPKTHIMVKSDVDRTNIFSYRCKDKHTHKRLNTIGKICDFFPSNERTNERISVIQWGESVNEWIRKWTNQ